MVVQLEKPRDLEAFRVKVLYGPSGFREIVNAHIRLLYGGDLPFGSRPPERIVGDPDLDGGGGSV